MKEKLEIYNPRFVGQRFNDHALPIEMLDDIVAIEDITIALAKHIYLEDNPERKRTPRGFTEGISIKLEGIEEGSTILKIALFVISTNLFPPENTKYFNKASERFKKVVQLASENKDFNGLMPENFLKYFNRIGKNLLDSEYIEFTPNKNKKAKLNKAVRKRLILGSSLVKEYNEEIEIRGTIVEMDKAKKSFQIQLINGTKITGNLDEIHLEEIQLAFNKFETGQLISIKGNGKFNRDDKLTYIDDIDSINMLDELDVPARLENILLLKDGWFDERSKKLDKAKVHWLSLMFDENYNPELPLPTLFPTPDGDLIAEWTNSRFEISAEFSLLNKTALIETLSLKDDKDFEKEISIKEQQGWKDLNEILLKYLIDV